jgi:Protein of unknown function (DUF3987)
MLYRDELAGWLLGMNKYRSGDDRQFYMECWSGGAYHVERKTKGGSIHVEDLFLAITGAIQPGGVAKLFQGGDVDGLTGRFGLLAWPKLPDKVVVVDSRPDYDARDAVEARLRDMRAHIAIRENLFRPGEVLRFSRDAYEVFADWLEINENRPERHDSDSGFGAHLANIRDCLPAWH